MTATSSAPATGDSWAGGGAGHPTVIGLDLSLSATGCATPAGEAVLSTRLTGVERLAWYSHQVNSILDAWAPDLVVIEDYSYASHGAHSHELGELGGVVRLLLHYRQCRWVAVAPASLKKWLSGKGNASKVAMAMAAARAGYHGPAEDNCVDSWSLRQMGLYAYGAPSLPETAYRNAAVAAVAWPKIEVPA